MRETQSKQPPIWTPQASIQRSRLPPGPPILPLHNETTTVKQEDNESDIAVDDSPPPSNLHSPRKNQFQAHTDSPFRDYRLTRNTGDLLSSTSSLSVRDPLSPVRTSENPRHHGHTRLTPPMSDVQISNVNGPHPHTPGDPIRGLPHPQHLHHPLHPLHSRPFATQLPFPIPHHYPASPAAAMALLQGHNHIISPHYMNLQSAQFSQPNPHSHLSRLADPRRSVLPDPRTGVLHHNIHNILQSQGTTLEPVTNTNHHTDLSTHNLGPSRNSPSVSPSVSSRSSMDGSFVGSGQGSVNGTSGRRKRKNTEEIPEWVKVDNIEDFKRLCEVHCGNDEDKIKEMTELRRKIKNRAAAMRSREKRVENTDQIKTLNQELNEQKQLVDDEWNRVMSDRKNIERLVEIKVEERENFLVVMKRARICHQ